MKGNLELTQQLNRESQSTQYTYVNPYYQTDQIPKKPLLNRAPIDLRNSFAIDLNPIQAKSFSMHCKPLGANILLIVGIFLTLYTLLGDQQDENHTTFMIIICSFIYISYIAIANQGNSIKEYITNLKRGDQFENEYESNRKKSGRFHFSSECYHIEKQERIIRKKDSRNRYYDEKQVSQVKVVTYKANEEFPPKKCYDQSGTIDRIRSNTNIVFISFKVEYLFKNEESKKIFDSQYKRFRQKHKRDLHQDYRYEYFVPQLSNKLAFYAGTLPCNLQTWYYIFLLTGVIWPYCVWLQCKIRRFQIILKHQLIL